MCYKPPDLFSSFLYATKEQKWAYCSDKFQDLNISLDFQIHQGGWKRIKRVESKVTQTKGLKGLFLHQASFSQQALLLTGAAAPLSLFAPGTVEPLCPDHTGFPCTPFGPGFPSTITTRTKWPVWCLGRPKTQGPSVPRMNQSFLSPPIFLPCRCFTLIRR